jgi:ABC-type nitrate/sulfonate/bicarbonate transport system substrate-binding protein
MPKRSTGFSGFGFRVSSSESGRKPRHGTRKSKPRRRASYRRTGAGRVVALCSIVFFIVISSLAAASAQEKIRIAPSSPGLAAWPVHLAAREKFFAAEGLDAEIIVMRTNVGIAALVTGSIDFTTAGGSAMRAAVNGAPLKMVLNITKKADLWILAQKNIQRVEELRGKMIGVGGNWGTQFYKFLRR